MKQVSVSGTSASDKTNTGTARVCTAQISDRLCWITFLTEREGGKKRRLKLPSQFFFFSFLPHKTRFLKLEFRFLKVWREKCEWRFIRGGCVDRSIHSAVRGLSLWMHAHRTWFPPTKVRANMLGVRIFIPLLFIFSTAGVLSYYVTIFTTITSYFYLLAFQHVFFYLE